MVQRDSYISGEQYHHPAVGKWMGGAFPENKRNPDHDVMGLRSARLSHPPGALTHLSTRRLESAGVDVLVGQDTRMIAQPPGLSSCRDARLSNYPESKAVPVVGGRVVWPKSRNLTTVTELRGTSVGRYINANVATEKIWFPYARYMEYTDGSFLSLLLALFPDKPSHPAFTYHGWSSSPLNSGVLEITLQAACRQFTVLATR